MQIKCGFAIDKSTLLKRGFMSSKAAQHRSESDIQLTLSINFAEIPCGNYETTRS